MNRRLLILPLGVLLASLATACGDGPDPEPTPTPTISNATAPAAPALAPGEPIALDGPTMTPSGLMYVDEVVGDGVQPTINSTVVVHYTGKFAENGQVFDSSVRAGRPATFSLRGVIPGFAEAILGMKEGGKRIAYIPSELGYGEEGFPPIIPPNTDLVFEIELIEVVQ